MPRPEERREGQREPRTRGAAGLVVGAKGHFSFSESFLFFSFFPSALTDEKGTEEREAELVLSPSLSLLL